MKGFIKISRYAGMREDLVQAGGGNSSVKLSDTEMAVKASGFQMSDIDERKGYTIVNPEVIRNVFNDDLKRKKLNETEGAQLLAESIICGGNPSIETFIHATLKKYTLHTHPTIVNALMCRKSGENELKNLIPNAVVIPYSSPGVALAKQYYTRVVDDDSKDTIVVFLKNHGLVVSSNTADNVIGETERITARIEEYLGIEMKEYHHASCLWNLFPDKIVWLVKDIDIVKKYRIDGLWDYCFCPDCVVYLGKKVLSVRKDTTIDQVKEYCDRNGEPTVVEFNDRLYLLADSVKKARELESILSFSAQVSLINNGIDCEYIPENEQTCLVRRDDEKYRKMMR